MHAAEQRRLLADVESFCRELREHEELCYVEHQFNDHLVPLALKHNLLGMPVPTGVVWRCAILGWLAISLCVAAWQHHSLFESTFQDAGEVLVERMILLICAPVVYPWYLLWILCFVPLLRGAQGLTGLVWSGTVALCYVLWRTSDWRMPPDALRWEYYPVAVMLGIEFLGICTKAPLARVQCADAGV